jgi:hypothetical protein|tara:strand:+ start:211 stop:1083 length:873 start_codon:yes stop_codon:yes gene_type:complete
MAVINSPFESQYGFKAPGFSVDNEGNITATSIITSAAPSESDVVDFVVGELNNAFTIVGYAASNPTITIARAGSYKFGLTVPNLGFTIYSALPSTKYNTGLVYQDSTTGVDAQGKLTGTLTFNVALGTPDVLYFGNAIGNVYGTINVIDPVGQFSTIDVNSTANATSSTTGAVTIAGGASVEKDFYIGGELNISGLGIPRLSSLTNLELNATNKVILQVDNIKLGELNSTGLAVTINNSTIDNTVIGATTPSTAAFTSGTVASSPTTDTSMTNRQYVDSTSLSLAIAFGL